MRKSTNLKSDVQARLDCLTKPPGSLGVLEEIVMQYCAVRGETLPPPPRKGMFVFCGDHGITAEGVSPYPSAVTRQMALNFVRGGAAINVLCRRFGIDTKVIDAGIAGDAVEGPLDARIGSGTQNFATTTAMTRDQADASVALGRRLAREAAGSFDLLAAGEMGIGNTTAAAAIFSALTGRDPSETAGRGAGLDDRGVARKADVIRTALARHNVSASDPVGILAAVGGFEIGAIAGFYIGAAESQTPFVVDGFICTAAAMLARAMAPNALEGAFFSHCSAEAGHALMLADMGVRPLLRLDLRLGEGTGAALAMNLIETSLSLYREMATFEEAGVSSVK